MHLSALNDVTMSEELIRIGKNGEVAWELERRELPSGLKIRRSSLYGIHWRTLVNKKAFAKELDEICPLTVEKIMELF